MNADYLIGGVLSVGAHAALLLALSNRDASIPPQVHSVRARSLEVVALDASDVRRLLEPDLLPPLPDPLEAPLAADPRPAPAWPEAVLPAPEPRELFSAVLEVRPPEIGQPLAGPLERLETFQPIVVTPSTTKPDDGEPPAATPSQSSEAEPSPEDSGGPESGLPELADVQSLLLSRASVPYPQRARRLGIEGTTRVQIDVASDGRVSEARLVRSSGSRLLDRAALTAVRKWRFDMSAVRAAGLGSRFLQDVRFALR